MRRKLDLDEIKSIEVGILKYIAGICDEYGLRYYLAYGTLLGAIRHKGFIPWDDDIDIAMPRADYDKLVKIFNDRRGESRYDCMSPLDAGYYYDFAKVIDTTTFVQEKNVLPARCGVWVDIFPMDGLNKKDVLTHYKLMLYGRCRAFSVYSKFPHKTKGLAVPLEYLFWRMCRIIGYPTFMNSCVWLSQKYKYGSTDWLGIASSFPASKKYMKKEWFADCVDVDFEGCQFKAPIGFHDILTEYYGDYMQLPSEDKRVSHNIDAYLVNEVSSD